MFWFHNAVHGQYHTQYNAVKQYDTSQHDNSVSETEAAGNMQFVTACFAVRI
jgi:hypothetical protein